MNGAGFTSDKDETLKACYEKTKGTVCPDPSKRINWDGPHYTEAAYKLIDKGLVEGPFVVPSLKPSLSKIA